MTPKEPTRCPGSSHHIQNQASDASHASDKMTTTIRSRPASIQPKVLIRSSRSSLSLAMAGPVDDIAATLPSDNHPSSSARCVPVSSGLTTAPGLWCLPAFAAASCWLLVADVTVSATGGSDGGFLDCRGGNRAGSCDCGGGGSDSCVTAIPTSCKMPGSSAAGISPLPVSGFCGPPLSVDATLIPGLIVGDNMHNLSYRM